MADRKASDLVGASDLNGSEIWAGVQGGADCKLSADQLSDFVLEAARADPLIGAAGAQPYAEAAEQSALDAEEEANRAADEADRSQTAATTAVIAGQLYPDTATGNAVASEGGYYYVVSPSSNEIALLYRKVSGSPVSQGKSIPSSALVSATVEDDSQSAAAQIIAPPVASIDVYAVDYKGAAIVYFDRVNNAFVVQMVGDENQSFANASTLNAIQSDTNKRILQVDGAGLAIDYYDLVQQGRVIKMVGDEADQQAAALQILAPLLDDGSRATIVNDLGQALEVIDPNGVRRSTALVSADYPPYAVQIEADAVRLYTRQGDETSNVYIQLNFLHQTNPARRADVWHLWEAYECAMTSPGVFTIGQKMVQQGEWELAGQFKAATGRAYDHVGGTLHGNEELTEFHLAIDGVFIDPADADNFGYYTPSIVEAAMHSDLFLLSTVEADQWSEDNPKFADCWKYWRFTPEKSVRNRTIIGWIDSGALSVYDYDHFYVGMVPILRLHGSTLVTHTGAFGITTTPMVTQFPSFNAVTYLPSFSAAVPDFTSVPGFVPGSSESDTADHCRVWGDRYSAEWRAISGWGQNSSDIYVSTSDQYNKIYPSWVEVAVNAGTTLAFEYEVNLSINVGA